MGKPSKQERESLPLQAWLWQLDCIQEKLGQVLLDRDLHVGFSLRPHVLRLDWEFDGLETHAPASESQVFDFSLGPLLAREFEVVSCYTEPDSGALRLDLRDRRVVYSEGEPRPAGEKCPIVLRDELGRLKRIVCKEGAYASEPGRLVEWGIWYYIPTLGGRGEAGPEDKRQQAVFARRVLNVQDALLELCAHAPDAVAEGLGADPLTFRHWPTVLFYLAYRKQHPMLTCYGTPGVWATVRAGAPDSEDFAAPNAYWFELTLSFRSASECALAILRRLVEHDGDGKANGPGQRSETAPRIPLSKRAVPIYERLRSLKEHEAMTLPEIQEWYANKTNKELDDGTWKRIRKELEPYGLRNRANVGYYIREIEPPETSEDKAAKE
jgi:hypothetical protein